jgi:hypothetical protein
MTRYTCLRSVVADTLEYMRAAGRRNKECVVLWLAPRTSSPDAPPICEAYLPLQEARKDQFRIPPEGMNALMAHLRTDKLRLAAQVHSHPREAFHSIADDEWAVIRREGALSVVVPDFAARTTPDNFVAHAKFYQLSSNDRWLELETVGSAFEICHDDHT